MSERFHTSMSLFPNLEAIREAEKKTIVREPVTLDEHGQVVDDPGSDSEEDLINRIKARINRHGVIRRTPVADFKRKDDPDAEVTLTDILSGRCVFEVTEEIIDEAMDGVVVGGEVKDPQWSYLTSRMIHASCAFFAQEVLTGPAIPPYNGKYFINEHHQEWDDLVCNYDRICVLAPRDHGKCSRGDDLLLASDGSRIRMDKWKGGELVVWDDKSRKFVTAKVGPARENGIKSVFKIETKTGRNITVTGNHPFRTWGGWKLVDKLEVGDRIAVARDLSGLGKNEVENAWLLGLLVGDGCFGDSNLTLSIADEDVVSKVRTEVEAKQWRLEPVKGAKIAYRILTTQDTREGIAKHWVDEFGLLGKLSGDKFVPNEVYQATDECIALFVSGYLQADGFVNRYGGGSIEFYSTSERLLEGVQHLLTRLGVISVLSRKLGAYKGNQHKSWRLTVRGADTLRLAKVLSLVGGKQKALNRLVRQQESKGLMRGKCIDRFPKEVWEDLKSGENCHNEFGEDRSTSSGEPTRSKVYKVAKRENNENLMGWVESPILWDEITGIEYDDCCMTWALQVPVYQTYVSNDIVNHNTFFFNFAYPLWKACTMPWGKGFILSSTAPQAERILEDIISEVEGNPELHWLIPSRKDLRKWSSKYVRFSNEHRIYARGFGTKVRGFHPDYIIGDDVLNDEVAYSEVVRRKQSDYWFNAISNMITPGGQIIIVGTPFHKDDLYGELKDNEEYEYRKYQAILEGNKALWPERYSMEDPPPKGVASLPRKKREIGSIRFTREFMCEPVADDMSLFPLRLFKGDPIEQYNVKLGMPAEFWQKAGITCYMGCDFAMSSNVSADFTVVWTMGVDQAGNRWIVDIQRAKGLPYQEQLSMIVASARKYSPALIFLEDNQMQRIFGDELIRTSDLPIKKFTTGVQKNSLDKGVPSLRVLLENGKFRIPRGDKRSVELTDIWIEEMRSITWVDGKIQSVGGHDDTVIGCWICDQAIKHGGFKYSFGGEEDLEGSFEDFMDELMGITDEEKATVLKEHSERRKEGGNEVTANLGELQGEELLRAIVKRQMRVAVPRSPVTKVTEGNGKDKKDGLSIGDLVKESDFW